jgi:hypothetical protein
VPTSSTDPLILALGAAVAGPKLLVSKGGKSPVEGIFPSGKKGKELVDRALAEGYLTRKEERVKSGRSTTTQVYGVITEKGMRAFASLNSPKDALTALVPAVTKLSNTSAADPAKIITAIETATAKCVGTISNALAALREEVLQAMTAADALAPAPILAALSTALAKVEAAPAAASTDPARVADAIVEFVTDWARERTVGPPFDALMKHLRGLFPHITPGEFHDTLRRLASANPPRIKLSVWSKTQHELPEPELALFIKHTVTYYAHPVA